MSFIKSFFRKKSVRFLFGLLIAGIILVILPYLISAEQCPSNYTQRQVNTSNCIIGADIGSGLIWLLGVSVTLVALAGLCVMLVARIPSRLTRLVVGLLIVAAFLLVTSLIGARSNPNEIDDTVGCSADNVDAPVASVDDRCVLLEQSP